ncbi:MAG: preprotein translocase subunit SecG [Puniceicoccales bacterium]|nr:preprotein translocase subunit SecG [Puniceicoccales bacterium]
MSAFFIFVLTTFLLVLCMITILFILMQRPSEESGMGATLGGNAVTSILGGEGVNTLARITKYCVAIFFSVSFILSLLYMALEKDNRPQNLFQKKEVWAAVNTETDKGLLPPNSETSSKMVDSIPADRFLISSQEKTAASKETAPEEAAEETAVRNIEEVKIPSDDGEYVF